MPAMLRDGGLLAIFPTPPAAPLFATADFPLRALGDMVAGTTAGLLSKVVIISGLAHLFCVEDLYTMVTREEHAHKQAMGMLGT